MTAPAEAPGPPVVALVGPTASGKSGIALEVAERVRGDGRTDRAEGPARVELVSVDSMAVYRGMDIGTAKPTPEVRARVPYHLVDLVDPSEEFTVQQFQQAALAALADIAGRGSTALLVGGTGLYLRSVVDDLSFPGRFPEVAAGLDQRIDGAGPLGSPEGQAVLDEYHHRLMALDPVAAARIEPTNRRRLVRALEVTLGSGRPFSRFGPGLDRYAPSRVTLVGVDRGTDELDQRIADRFAGLMDRGLLDEVAALAARDGGISRTARQALGYRELLAHLEEGLLLDRAMALAVQRTRTFARRQRAWFRRDPRIVWVDPTDDPAGAVVAIVGSDPGAAVGVGQWTST
jgi:tRNA dimethylallyltransferase